MFHQRLRYTFLVAALLFFVAGDAGADLTDLSHLEKDIKETSVSAGYRTVDTSDYAGRAAEYNYLRDSATFDLVIKRYKEKHQFSLFGDFNNENDYFLDADYSYKSLVRFHLLSERLYHNLDHIPYDVTVPEARQDSNEATYSDIDKNAIYGRKVSIDSVSFRGKMPRYPAHANLSFWRMERKGKEQLRFVSENCFTGGCHMSSTTRNINRVTEEVKAGFDAHLGPVDIAFLQTFRKMKEKAENPNDTFGEHVLLGRTAGGYDHDVTPDAELRESTFMINLPPSGGFVTSASYTLGEREKTSNITGISRTDAETDYQKLAADVTYTPAEEWSFNFRYRMFDMDSSGPRTLTTSGSNRFNNGTVPVRDSVDINTDSYAAYASYRPVRRLTFKGEFEREVINRSDTGEGEFSSFSATPKLVWDLPEEETTDRLRLSFYSRMLEKSALKINGWYEHKNVDNPAYGTRLTDSNEGFLSVSYRPSMVWGATSSIDILNGEGSGRDKESENFAAGFWLIPNEIISADLNYGYLRTNIDEEIDFGTEAFNIPGTADYEQDIHTLAAGINIRPIESLNCRLEGYHIRSEASFDPDFAATATATPAGLEEISKVDISQNGAKVRVSWDITEMLMAQFEYAYDDYDDKNADIFDGSVQTCITSLTGTF